MRLRILSDLHLEFGGLELPALAEPEDLIILAGDIAIYTDGVAWAAEQATRLNVPVLMVAGNHEFYRVPPHYDHTFDQTLGDLRNKAAETGGLVTFLEDDWIAIDGVRFLGATLWTDFELHHVADLSMFRARRQMNDYSLIRSDDQRVLMPTDTLHRHQKSRQFIEGQLNNHSRDTTVVITHHAPSSASISAEYVDSTLSPAYASDLETLILDAWNLALWVHGHIHASSDYEIGATRIVANPRGYDRYDRNNDFDPTLTVEI